MSAPLRLNSEDASRLSRFLQLLTLATNETGCEVGTYGPVAIRVSADAELEISYDNQGNEYVVIDRIGS